MKILFILLGLSTLLLSGCNNKKSENTSDKKPIITETLLSPTTPPIVYRKVTLYKGIYRDTSMRQYDVTEIDKNVTPISREIEIINITDTSFEFRLIERIYGTDQLSEIIPTSTAYFTDDGYSAFFYNQTTYLTISFPDVLDDNSALFITFEGISEYEDIVFMNSEVEGHESG